MTALTEQMNMATQAVTLAKADIEGAYKLASPILAVALLPLIADAERLRQRLAGLAEATRQEGK